jgi:DNA recombination-mediator protein A
VSPWRLPHLTPPIVRLFMLRRNTIKPLPRLTPLDAPRRQSIRVEPALRDPRRGAAKQLRLGQLAVSKTIPLAAISPRREMGAYEALWLRQGASFKTIAEKFAKDITALPSDFVSPSEADECADEVMRILKEDGVHRFGVRVNHAGDYPMPLRDARHPVELLYYQGAWELTESRCVAVVGSREATDNGLKRAQRIARELVARKFTVFFCEGVSPKKSLVKIAEPSHTRTHEEICF